MDKKILLSEGELSAKWYNILPDLPEELPPPLNPATGKPLTPDDLLPIFPMALIEQEVSQERWIEIPDDILRAYRLWRPTPLVRAYALEEHLGTPARIHYKNESFSPLEAINPIPP